MSPRVSPAPPSALIGMEVFDSELYFLICKDRC